MRYAHRQRPAKERGRDSDIHAGMGNLEWAQGLRAIGSGEGRQVRARVPQPNVAPHISGQALALGILDPSLDLSLELRLNLLEAFRLMLVEGPEG